MLIYIAVLAYTACGATAYPLGQLATGHAQGDARERCQFHTMGFPVDDHRCLKCTLEPSLLVAGAQSEEVIVLLVNMRDEFFPTIFKFSGRLFAPGTFTGRQKVADVNMSLVMNELTPNGRRLTKCQNYACAFKFNPPTYVNPLVPKGNFQINIGYSMALLSCSQPLCLDANVDGVSYSNSSIDVYRGFLIFTIPLDGKPKSITPTTRINYAGQTDRNKVAVQAAWHAYGVKYVVADGDCYYLQLGFFTRNNTIVDLDHQARIRVVAAYYAHNDVHFFLEDLNGKVSLRSSKLSSATVTGRAQNEEQIQNKYRQTGQNPVKQSVLNIEVPDAVFVEKDLVYILKGWKYATVPLANINQGSALKWRFSFLEVFGCDTQIYKRRDVGRYVDVDDYVGYLQKFDAVQASGNPLMFPLVLLVICTIVQGIAVIVAFVVWYKFKKQTEQGLISMMKTYRKKGKKGNDERISRIMYSKLGSRIDGPHSRIREAGRSGLSAMDRVGHSRVGLGTRPSRKRRKK